MSKKNYYKDELDEDLMEYSSWGDYEAEIELEERGYVKSKGHWVNDDSSTVFAIGIIKIALVIALLIFVFIGAHFIIGMSVVYQVYIYIGFVVTTVLMYLTRAKSKFFNFLFYLGCLAIATRQFANFIGHFIGEDYMTYVFIQDADTDVLFKSGFYYIVYTLIVPYLMMKSILAIVREIRGVPKNKKVRNPSGISKQSRL
ncbi:hypothetical protein [Bacillus weihaiensis]|uniref:Transmembrane protein n=1 Tax=Bacillus weihaiensis TaxID=1547283 RepID=A0A1L3MP84_9BACI|nr:hypothetical protein [Bacillus weihaiensis]APH04166.1 hypothetical protein A9C19_05090 [Bacillus weihaiensis]